MGSCGGEQEAVSIGQERQAIKVPKTNVPEICHGASRFATSPPGPRENIRSIARFEGSLGYRCQLLRGVTRDDDPDRAQSQYMFVCITDVTRVLKEMRGEAEMEGDEVRQLSGCRITSVS